MSPLVSFLLLAPLALPACVDDPAGPPAADPADAPTTADPQALSGPVPAYTIQHYGFTGFTQSFAIFGSFPANLGGGQPGGQPSVSVVCGGQTMTATPTFKSTYRVDATFVGVGAPRDCTVILISYPVAPLVVTISGDVPASTGQRFVDVPGYDPYYPHIQTMAERGITAGTTVTTYGPDQLLTRGQMAVFITRAINLSQPNGWDLRGGTPDNFDAPDAPYFTDVPPGHPYFLWIQKMKQLGITSGCAADRYCPDDAVTHGQMAVFATRAKYRESFSSSTTPYFPADVGPSHPYFRYVQDMRDELAWCGRSHDTYGDGATVTRAEMAAIITRRFFGAPQCAPL